MGDSHQRDRVTLWFRGCLLLHFPTMAVLGESRHCQCFCSIRYRARSKKGISFIYILLYFFFSFMTFKDCPFNYLLILFIFFLLCSLNHTKVIATDANTKDDRKILLPEEKKTASNFITIWDFEGSLKYSPMFYG